MMFSLRIVNVDSYQSAPTKGYDVCYSEFRGCEIFKVPIIRIFGITPAGQKGCLHVHGVFPYFSIRCTDVFPNIEAKSLRKCMQELALDIDKALNIASRNCNSHRQHVYKIIVTEHIPFYGFHEKAEEFLKIYFYNPFDVSRTAELMTNGVILNKFIQPYEAHIPYILQFFIDYNLFGMNLINVSKFKFRASEEGLVSPMSPLRNQSLSSILDDSSNAVNKVWNVRTLSSSQVSSLSRQTVCELEADCCSSEIMNRLNESFSSGKNPGLLAIWEEEKQRRKAENDTSQITPLPSQERADFIETESENFYKKKVRKILESFDMLKVCPKEKKDHMSTDLADVSSPNLSDLSSTQDEEMLNMMLSLVNSQSTQLDDDSILGLNHQSELQNESVEDETLEMSQLFTGELEEIWSSQMSDSDTEKNGTHNNSASLSTVNEQPMPLVDRVIPQLDGAFDDDLKPDHKKPKPDENASQPISEESLIQSCNLFQPVVQLSPVFKFDIESPSDSRPESVSYSEFMDEDSSLPAPSTKIDLPVCVPISRNAHCSLIMNFYENSNDVNIEHTCTTRGGTHIDALVDAEDPSNVVFEILTKLIYKVECSVEGKVSSCYEDFIEEYKGESCSSMLFKSLNKEEKDTLYKIKIAPPEKVVTSKKEISGEIRLPIKKRIYINTWGDADQCHSCSHPCSMDFSKIGKEVVILKKLSEADFIKHFKLNSLKVVIPPLPLDLHTANLTKAVKTDGNNSPKRSSLILPHKKKDFKLMVKESSLQSNDNKEKITEQETTNVMDCEDYLQPSTSLRNESTSVLSSTEISQNVLPVIKCRKLTENDMDFKDFLEPSTSSRSEFISFKEKNEKVFPIIKCQKLTEIVRNVKGDDLKSSTSSKSESASISKESNKNIFPAIKIQTPVENVREDFEDDDMKPSKSCKTESASILSSKKRNVYPIIKCQRLNISAISDKMESSHVADFKVTSGICNEGLTVDNKDIKIIGSDSKRKILSCNLDSKTTPLNEDIKMLPTQTASKNDSCDTNLEVATTDNFYKIPASRDDSVVLSNTNSKTPSNDQDYKNISNKVDENIKTSKSYSVNTSGDTGINNSKNENSSVSDNTNPVNINENATPDGANNKMTPGDANNKITPDDSNANNRITPDDASNKITPDDTSNKTSPDGTNNKTTPDGTNNKTIPDGTNNKTTPDDINNKTSADDTKNKTTPDGTNNKTTPDSANNKTSPDDTNNKTSVDDTNNKTAPNDTNKTSVDDISNKTSVDNTNNKTLDDANNKTALDDTNNKTTLDDTNNKTALDDTNNKTTLDDKNNKAENFIDSIESKNCAAMSELRLYRRKKASMMKEDHFQRNMIFDTNLQHGSNDDSHQSMDCGAASIGSRVHERNSSNLQIEYEGPSSKCNVPVVQLEPCKDLIDKYCKSETDTDCLILSEISHQPHAPQSLPSVKEKRFFRSRAGLQKDQNLRSKVIMNHKLTLNGSRFKTNRFAANKTSRKCPDVNFTVNRNDGPNLRKRSADFDSPNKKKLLHSPGSKFASFQREKKPLDKKLEQVYDFESHLNADDYDLDTTRFSRYSLKKKSNSNVLKKDLSCKLSLKLNRKNFSTHHDDYIPEYGITINSSSQSNRRPRRLSTFVNYNEDRYEPRKENIILTKRLKRSSKDGDQYENSLSDSVNTFSNSAENSDWSIDDIPISQLRPPETLKCTISKKKINFVNNSHVSEKLPIPKFKVRKKKRNDKLSLSIKLKNPALNSLDSDSDFKIQENSFHYITSKKRKKSKKSKRKSQVYASALDVKQKYKKHKNSKHKYRKHTVLQYYNSALNHKISNSSASIQDNENESPYWEKKPEFCKPDTPSFPSYNSTPKDEISDISNSSPFTEDHSDDSKRSKNSLRMKFKLKRITTRSNEERLVVVGKELEGIDEDSDECESKHTDVGSTPVPEPMCDVQNEEIQANCKKTLGTKYYKKDRNNFKLKTKFKCPLIIKKVEKTVINLKEDKNREFFERKIPKIKCKPLLANISKDFLSENMNHIVPAPAPSSTSPQVAQDILVISPKKKSPLKAAESFKKELSQLNEMVNIKKDFKSSNIIKINLKSPSSEIPFSVCKISRRYSADEAIDDSDASSSSHSKLHGRKSSTGCKIPSRRNSLRCQDFKKYFDSDNEDNSSGSATGCAKHQEKLDECDSDFQSTSNPCAVKLRRLSATELEKYMSKPVINVHRSDNLINCDPLIASFPSPIIDSKSTDSYIDPRKIFENLFTFSSPSHSPVNYNAFEPSPLLIENDMSCGPFSNESSEHSKKETLKTNFHAQNPLKPSEVFKSVERSDMGVLWNLAYFSPPQKKASEKTSCSTALVQRNLKDAFNRKENSVELDDLQKLASRANQLCSVSCNLMEFESENSLSLLNEKVAEVNTESKISFKNILDGSNSKILDELESLPLFSQTPTNFDDEPIMSNKSDSFDVEKEIMEAVKEEPGSDPVFEPLDALTNVRILDFQECLVESDSEMNPLLNESEIESVMSSADMILSNSIDAQTYEQCLQTDLSFDESNLSIQNKPKCASEEPKNHADDDVFIKNNTDCSLQKQLDADLTCNNAIITAADTSSLLIPSYKNNTIPVLAINNPCQEENVNFNAFEEQDLSASGQFFPVVLAPVPLAENTNYIENPVAAIKETASGPQECVNFLEDNELLQSCSVSSTSDIENKNIQATSALGIPFNGEEDILSMIVKSCDIGEEFDINMNPGEESYNGSISSATICNNVIDSNYVMSGPNFIISSQPEQNSFQTNSENAVSSSSENNVSQKNAEIVVIKTEPVDVPDVEHIVYEVQDKSIDLNSTDKSMKLSQELLHNDVLLDSMIHSFYGDDSLYGFRASANNDNISLLCPTFQNPSSFVQDMEKLASEYSSSFLKSSLSKGEENILEISPFKSDNYAKNLSVSQIKVVNENNNFQIKNIISSDKVPLGIPSNSLFIAHPFQNMSSKKYTFTPCSKPPSRDLVESSVTINSENKDNLKSSNVVDEDSLSSDSSLSSQISTNDIPVPNVFNKPSSDKNECLSSQNSQSLAKGNTPLRDDKSLIKSPILFQDKTVFHSPFSNHLVSTPSTSNNKKEFPLPAVVVSPINKETGLTADTNKRKRKLVFDEDSEGPLKVFKSNREKIFTLFNKYGRSNSHNKSMESLENSYSQIEGPTLDNSRGFKVGADNYGDAQVRHEVQHLTIMSLEVHVNTRNDLRPNPKFDSVTAIFYCIYNDNGVKEEEEIVGMIVVDPSSLHQTSGQNSSETLRNYLLLCPGVKNGFIYCVENEISLFEKLVKVIREWDPDILIGYEIQMSSWGYLIERAELLNINLRLLLSRLTDKKETKLLPVEQDPTVVDQTADLSRLNIIGRIVLCVWRLMRKEVILNVYTFENVYYHVLHKRTPLYAFHDLTSWFLGSQKEKVIRYYVIRVQGCIHLLEKLNIIGRTSELARLFGIQFYEVLSRGSQFRVESMMLRTAAPMSYIPVSPSARQRSHSRAPECVPLILEPESRFYIDPVVVLDFQSLYPSMIIAYNYCFSTCLGRVEHFGKNVPFEFGCTSLSVPVTLLQKLQNDIHVSPSGIAFIKSSVRRGILPSMLEEILNTRIMVKQSMKRIKDNNALKRLLDARQLGLKLISNVTYGYTGASFSGRMPSVEVADSIVGKGRETLERAIHMIENTSKWRAKVVYGDTDSLFILLPGRTKKQAFEIGQEIADAVTADNPKPVKLKFEKVYLPCVLQTKKRYVGFMYETVDQEDPVFDAKGIETVRRDSCPATSKILEKSLKILFKTYDVSLVKNYVQKQFSRLLSGRASIIDCIFAKEYRGMSGYRPGACVPALEIAKKRLAKDPRSEPRVGERVPYVVVCGFPGLPVIQLVREPFEVLKDSNLRINASYYITRVITPPLERVFNLLGADIKAWYTSLARTVKPSLPMTRVANQHRGTLSQYFVTLSCPSCEKPTFTTVCDDCREDLQGTTIALNEKIRQWERTVDHLTQICSSCTKSGSSTDSCVSLDCPMLFKLSAAKKDLSQAPYLRKVLAHELF